MENNPSSSLPDDNDQTAVAKQRRIQQHQDGMDAAKSEKDGGTESKKPPVQAVLTQQSEPPLPAQHLEKPGLETGMLLQPRFMAEGYKGSAKLLDHSATKGAIHAFTKSCVHQVAGQELAR